MRNPFRTSYTVIRSLPGEYVNGIYTEPAPEPIFVSASVQPLGMKDMDVLPDGQRTGRAVRIYSDVELYPAKQEGEAQELRKADRLIYDGHKWEVVSCVKWQSTQPLLNNVNHYKAYAVRSVGS